jgi:hypothetical protein
LTIKQHVWQEVNFNVVLRWQWCLSWPIVTKMVIVDGNKWETLTMNCYFTKCGNMTIVTFGVGGDGSKPCIAPMASYISHWRQIMAKKRKKFKILIKGFSLASFIHILAIVFHNTKHWSRWLILITLIKLNNSTWMSHTPICNITYDLSK